MSSRRFLSPPVGLVLALLLAGCARREPLGWANVREVTPAFLAARAAEDPALACDRHGRVALTWVTSDSLGQDLWLSLSTDGGVTFAKPMRVDPRPGSVSSMPESRPLPVFGPVGALLVTWSQRRALDPRVADLVVSGGGVTVPLGPPIAINDDWSDDRPDYHGAAGMAVLPDGTVFAAWIDYRESDRILEADEEGAPFDVGRPGDASIFYAISRDGGQSWSDNRSLNNRACSSSRPVVQGDTAETVAVAYRAAGGPRGPALAISRDRGTSFVMNSVVVADGPPIGAPAADGPALSMGGSGDGFYAWHSDSADGGAWVAPWRARVGLAGTRRSLTDSLTLVAHPRLARFGDATLVTLEGRPRSDSTRRVVAVRSLAADGGLTPWIFLGAEASDGWNAALDARTALVCWVERAGGEPRVRVARLTRYRG